MGNTKLRSLIVKIYQARKLAKRYEDKGKIFVMVECENEKFKTNVMAGTNNPIWKEECEFDISSPKSTVKIAVMNRDTWKDDVIASFSLQIVDIIRNPLPAKGKWFSLSPMIRQSTWDLSQSSLETVENIDLCIYAGFAESYEPFSEEELDEACRQPVEVEKQSRWKLKMTRFGGSRESLSGIDQHASKEPSGQEKDSIGLSVNVVEGNRPTGITRVPSVKSPLREMSENTRSALLNPAPSTRKSPLRGIISNISKNNEDAEVALVKEEYEKKITQMEQELKVRERKVHDLEEYVDRVLLVVMEKHPSLIELLCTTPNNSPI